MKILHKTLQLFFPGLSLFFLFGYSIVAQEVSCVVDVPAKAVAGTEVPVKVTIYTGQNRDFARFRQELPVGFEVRPVVTANADFSFRDHIADFIWLKLPETETIVLEYMIIPDVRLTGIFNLSGRFSYIHDNDRDEAVAPERKIEIMAPSSTPVTMQETPVKTHKLAVFRDKPVLYSDGSSWIVHLLVSRADIKKLARIEENIPRGFVAENMDGKGAIFSYKDGKLKYIWMTLPDDPLFVVTYRLRPVGGTSGMPAPDGVFSFMKDNEPGNIPIIPADRAISAGLDRKGLEDLYADLMSDASIELIQKGIPKELTQNAPSEGAKSAADLLNETVPAEETATSAVTGESENKPGQKTEIVTHRPSPQKGIYFRVQILATSKPIEVEEYFRKHHIPGHIYREYLGGLYKYTTGSFTLYREARAFIDDLFNKTDLEEAFVTAYREDQRISVREALNATGQKWFK